ncbi:TetR family transcriptional regulator [Haloarcula quadrata]|jgi:AcrR family transcriptional regulator|uniref:TetR/AcrR family transcriptional regulator n=2 Tax=Haloarcula TaxID=2237 RepID=Q5V6G6_HALMA|nr:MULTISPECIES: TetR/AcrR family transcriptional regulator [Haloarcula]AAV44886.1 transcription regulator [Haloarcula marismortui ATCC 43049]NHN66028.1 TetR/AcrR family transcriptional regulator [Haloarcula sp. JP-Z28]NHX40868.1 TetR/AcrR family transcriptional regulator [Haloarcula sp. R1-2]QCP90191.1 TetR/AcrR family transcriptional regulator [Haloarcula marismortui ATCC 43049]RKS78183.1 TetR family transcriptional regulator [Haloarcula quadrata]
MTDESDALCATEKEIMHATHRALVNSGYAELSISRISDELDKAKSTIYHYYDSKDALLLRFLRFTVDRFEATINTSIGDNPKEDLNHIISTLLPCQLPEEKRQLHSVLVTLSPQALERAVFREQFTEIDTRLATIIEKTVRRGVDADVFRDVDPTHAAEHILATIKGTMYSRLTTNREAATAAAKASLFSYIDSHLIS